MGRFSAPFREFGAGLGTLYLFDRILRMLSSEWRVCPYVFVVQPVPEKPFLPPMMSKHGHAERLTPSSPWLSKGPVPLAVFLERLNRGDRGVAALRKDQLLGYAWWSTKAYFEEEVRCNFELEDRSCSAFDFDVYVAPEHRMGLGFLSIWDALSEELRRSGVERTYSRISRFNLASVRAHSRYGAEEVGRVLFVRAGVLTLAVSNQFPFVRAALGGTHHLRLGPSGVAWVKTNNRA